MHRLVCGYSSCHLWIYSYCCITGKVVCHKDLKSGRKHWDFILLNICLTLWFWQLCYTFFTMNKNDLQKNDSISMFELDTQVLYLDISLLFSWPLNLFGPVSICILFEVFALMCLDVMCLMKCLGDYIVILHS